MKIMIEAFTSIFFVSVISVLLVSMIAGYVSVNNARNYHSSIIDRLENSDYQQEYIDELLFESQKKGYIVEIVNVSHNYNRVCYYVKLEYKNSVKSFGLINDLFKYEGIIEGYAI